MKKQSLGLWALTVVMWGGVVFAALSAVGVEITSLRNKANRLEELFLNLTERKGGLSGLRAPQAVSP